MKPIVKRILAVMMLAALLFTLCSCGGGGTSGRTCPSCGRTVSSLVTKRDNAGVTYSWCSRCWSDYHSIAGY